MTNLHLDKHSAEPLYKQLATYIINNIEENSIVDENGRFPTERELSEEFQVSRITVRQALKILEDKNIITREQGKGTFLSGEKIVQPITGSHSFTQIIKKSGHVPSAKLLSASIQLADEVDQQFLGLKETDYVVVIKRLRYINDEPSAYEVSHFNQEYSFLLANDFNYASIYDFIQKERGIRFGETKRMLEITSADEEIASYLSIAEGDPLVLINGVIKDQNGITSHLAYEYLRADRFKFEI